MADNSLTKPRRGYKADILHYNHNCDVVIMIHRKHGNGDTVMFYGTEGGGVSFIGNKSDMKTSEGGEVAVKLFQKFVQAASQKSNSLEDALLPSPSLQADNSMVVYVPNGSIVAAGYVQPQRDLIHGCKIPTDHTCVMVTVTKPNYKAPLILGEETENSLLEKGKFFALPTKCLMNARLSPNNSLGLTPYFSTNKK